jgi:hypothetical protein
MEQSKNIKMYAAYLEERVAVFREVKGDFLRLEDNQSSRLKAQSWKEGLFNDVSCLQRQLKTLLECRFYLDSLDNDVIMEAYRLILKDLVRLVRVINEGASRILRKFHNLYSFNFLYL